MSLRLFTSDFSEMVTRRVVVAGTALDVDVVADRCQNRGSVRFTPAFTAANAGRLQLWSATAFVAAPSADVERDLLPQLRELDWSIDETRAAFQGRVQAALRPLGVTLALLGGLVLLATVVVVGQALGRQAEAGRSEAEATRAMGFTAGQVRLVQSATVLSVAVPGILVAVAVALAVSPLFPTGALLRARSRQRRHRLRDVDVPLVARPGWWARSRGWSVRAQLAMAFVVVLLVAALIGAVRPVRNICAESHAKAGAVLEKGCPSEQRWLAPPVTQAGHRTVRVT